MNRVAVLFICSYNSARSQMAEGLLRHIAGDRFDVYSAGTVATGVSPFAVRVMSELGIDISRHESKSLQQFVDQSSDWVITVCDDAAGACPTFPGAARRLHWSLHDPGRMGRTDEQRLVAFRQVRDRLRRLVEEFVAEEEAPA